MGTEYYDLINQIPAITAVVVVLTLVIRFIGQRDEKWMAFMKERDDNWRSMIERNTTTWQETIQNKDRAQYARLEQLSHDLAGVSLLLVYHHAAVTSGKELTPDDVLDLVKRMQPDRMRAATT